MGGTAGLAQALWNIGVLYEALERKPEAIEALTRAVELERRLGRADAEEHAAHLQRLVDSGAATG
jgi:tetratricopeptide (TPR) repeat protein